MQSKAKQTKRHRRIQCIFYVGWLSYWQSFWAEHQHSLPQPQFWQLQKGKANPFFCRRHHRPKSQITVRKSKVMKCQITCISWRRTIENLGINPNILAVASSFYGSWCCCNTNKRVGAYQIHNANVKFLVASKSSAWTSTYLLTACENQVKHDHTKVDSPLTLLVIYFKTQ